MTASPEVPAIELRNLSKAFGDVRANRDISLRVGRGTIHAIIGENGAGKSTAMKMLYGVHSPDSGEILVNGEPRAWRNPADAIAAGIGMVHQHFMLADPYSALENVLLGVERRTPALKGLGALSALLPLDRKAARERLDRLADQYGLRRVDWSVPIEELPVGIQQRIEILKLLYQDATVLILDEPTAVLTPQETAELFVNLRKLANEGKTILIITHKLKEVMSLSDDVTVFRAGTVVGQRRTRETNIDELASLMVGRKVNLTVEAPPKPVVGASVLELRNVTLRRPVSAEAESHAEHGERLRLKDLSLQVRAGEVVGIAGVEGNGQSELLQLVLHPRDYRKHSSGEVSCLGQTILSGRMAWHTDDIKKLGLGFIPEDRHREGLLLDRPIEENFLLGLQKRSSFSKWGFISYPELRRAAGRAVEEYDVRPRDLSWRAGGLSGGNQQKLIIAREFEISPKLLIAAQPTRGVDVGAIEFIHKRILQARTEGAGVLLVSSELDEVLALSDRILVMFAGQVVAEFERGQADERTLGLHMGGAKAV